MEKSQAKALFHKGIEEEEAEEELDEVTAENERILEEWDRLTQASEGSPQQSIEDDFPFEDFSNDDANGSSSQLQLNSTLSSVKRRQSMLQPRIDSLPIANTSAVSSSVEDSNTNEAEEEFTATVQLPSTLSALMEEVSMEQKKRRNDQENEEDEGEGAEEFDDHTEAIETDLRSLLHHIDEKHSFLDLRGDSSASHLSTSTSHHQSAIAAGVMDFEVFEDNESSKVADAHDVMEGGKSPRQSIMSEIFPMAGNQSSSNLMDISSTAQLDDDLHHLYQHPASNVAPSNTPSHTSSAYTSEHSILSHLGGAEEAILMTSTIAPSEHSSSSKKIRRALKSKSIEIFEDAGIEDKEEQEVGEEVQMEEEDDDVSGLSEEQDEAEGEEEEEEESLSFIGKKAKLLLEEIQTPPHTATHPAAHTAATAVKVIEGSQLTGLRQRLLNLKATVSTEAAPSTSAPPLSMQVEQVVEKVEQRRKSSATTSIPTAMKTPFSSRKSISANNKNTSEKKKKTTPKAMPMPMPAKATTTPITTTSEVVLPAVAQPTSEEWDMLIFAQWSKVVAVVEKMTSLTKTMSAHPRYTTIASYIHATVEENLCSATRFLRQLSAFLTSQLSLLWQHYMTAPRSTSSDYSLLYREELAITSSSAYSELVGSLTSSESGRGEYYLLRHQSAQWEEMWLELINSSLFEGIAQLKRQRHSISSTSATSSTSTDRFLSKALNIAPPPTPGVEVSVTSSSKALLQEVIEGNEEQRRQQTTLQQRVKEMAMQSSILNRFSFFRILSLLSNVIEVQVLLSDEAKIILHFHLRPGGKEEVHRVDGLDIDLSFSDTIRTTERSLISTYFAEVMTTEKWHGPLNPNDLQRLDKISEIPALLERVSGYVLALRAGLTMVKKIEEVYGSVKILRDSLLPSVYIEYEHSAYPVMMSLVSFLNYALEKSHLFIPSKDSIVMLLEDLRGLRRQTNTNTNTNSSSSHPFSSP